MTRARFDRVRRRLAELDLDALLLSIGADLPWLTGYTAMPLERLTMLVLPADGEATLVVVMPDGVGLEGRDAAAGREVAAATRPGPKATPTQLASDAVTTVEKIAAASGHPLPHVKPVAPATAAPSHGHRLFVWLVVAGALFGVAVALLLRARAIQRAAAR